MTGFDARKKSICVSIFAFFSSCFVGEGYFTSHVGRVPSSTIRFNRCFSVQTFVAKEYLDPLDVADFDGSAQIDPSVLVAAAITDGAVEEPVPRRLSAVRHMIPISVALTIAVFSMLEIAESIRELAERRSIGHAHGITILAALRLGRSVAFFKILRHKGTVVQSSHKVVRLKSKAIMHVVKGAAVLQTQTEELDEKAGELRDHLGNKKARVRTGRRLPAIVGRTRTALVGLVTSSGVAIVAASLAVVACIAEIIDDMQPGAHHGAALLALSELYYQVRRLKARVKKERNRTSKWRKSWFGRLWSRTPVGPCIAVAAAIYAAIEICEDLRPGAHHGVAILALAELVENINRSRILNQLSVNSNQSDLVVAPIR